MMPEKRPAARWLAPAVLLLVNGLYTAVFVRLSFLHYKLAGFPINDDVSNFNEGLRVLVALRRDGWPALPVYLWANPPHTLLPSLTCTLLFGLFGVADWLPYAANGSIVFALLLFVWHIARRHVLGWQGGICLSVIALGAPVVMNSVLVYQPVFPCAVSAALGSAAYADAWPGSDRRWQRFAAGILWIVAFLAKPTLFPQTLVLLMASAGLGWWLAPRETRSRALAACAVNAGIVAACAAPYYAAAWRHLLQYIRVGVASPPLEVEGALIGHLTYYLTGPSGRSLLGNYLWLGVASLAAYFCGHRLRRGLVPALGMLTLLCYALVTVNPHKHEHLGPPFQYLFLVLMLYAVAAIAQKIGRRSLWLAATLTVVFLRLPEPGPTREGASWQERGAALEAILAGLHGAEGQRAFLTTSGYLSVNTLWYQFAKRGWPAPLLEDLAWSDRIEDYTRQIEEADHVVATAPGNQDVFAFLPSARVEAQTLNLISRNSRFALAREVRTFGGGSYLLFRRRPPDARLSELLMKDPECRGQLLSGFHELEAGAWRWAARKSKVALARPNADSLTLSARVFVPEALIRRFGRTVLSARVDGRPLGAEEYRAPGLYDYVRPLPSLTRSAAALEIEFLAPLALEPGVDPRERAMIFVSIAVKPWLPGPRRP